MLGRCDVRFNIIDDADVTPAAFVYAFNKCNIMIQVMKIIDSISVNDLKIVAVNMIQFLASRHTLVIGVMESMFYTLLKLMR